MEEDLKSIAKKNDDLADTMFELEERLEELKSNSKRVMIETKSITSTLKQTIDIYNHAVANSKETLLSLATTITDEQQRQLFNQSLESVILVPFEELSVSQLNQLAKRDYKNIVNVDQTKSMGKDDKVP